MEINILQDMKNIQDKMVFRDNTKLSQLLEMTVTGGRNRLRAAKSRMETAERENQVWSGKIKDIKSRLHQVHNTLEQTKHACEQLKNGAVTSTDNLMGIDDINESIKNNKEILDVYKEVTGVQMDFGCPKGVIAGCVAVRDTIPSGSRLLPFQLNKGQNVQEEIWRRIEDAANSRSCIQVIPSNQGT